MYRVRQNICVIIRMNKSKTCEFQTAHFTDETLTLTHNVLIYLCKIVYEEELTKIDRSKTLAFKN